jgi:hypothetical protein
MQISRPPWRFDAPLPPGSCILADWVAAAFRDEETNQPYFCRTPRRWFFV